MSICINDFPQLTDNNLNCYPLKIFVLVLNYVQNHVNYVKNSINFDNVPRAYIHL